MELDRLATLHTTFNLLNPLRKDYRRELHHKLEFYKKLREDLPDEYNIDVFPPIGGYLPCGEDVDGGSIGFITCGSPNQWKIATRDHTSKGYETWEMSLTAFIVESIAQKIRPRFFPEWYPESPVYFVSGREHQASPSIRRQMFESEG